MTSGISYIGEIRMWTNGTRIPSGFVACDGKTYKINTYQPAYSLLGTIYGGDGVTTFAVPDMRGRTPIGYDKYNGLQLGAKVGTDTNTISQNNMPVYSPALMFASGGTAQDTATTDTMLSADALTATGTNIQRFATTGSTTLPTLQNNAVVQFAGGDKPVSLSNTQPSLVINYIICLDGIYPELQ